MSDTKNYLVVPASKDNFAGIKTLYLQVAQQGGGIARTEDKTRHN